MSVGECDVQWHRSHSLSIWHSGNKRHISYNHFRLTTPIPTEKWIHWSLLIKMNDGLHIRRERIHFDYIWQIWRQNREKKWISGLYDSHLGTNKQLIYTVFEHENLFYYTHSNDSRLQTCTKLYGMRSTISLHRDYRGPPSSLLNLSERITNLCHTTQNIEIKISPPNNVRFPSFWWHFNRLQLHLTNPEAEWGRPMLHFRISLLTRHELKIIIISDGCFQTL